MRGHQDDAPRYERCEEPDIEGQGRRQSDLSARVVVLRVLDLVDEIRRAAQPEEEATEATAARRSGDDESERRGEPTFTKDERDERSRGRCDAHRFAGLRFLRDDTSKARENGALLTDRAELVGALSKIVAGHVIRDAVHAFDDEPPERTSRAVVRRVIDHPIDALDGSGQTRDVGAQSFVDAIAEGESKELELCG